MGVTVRRWSLDLIEGLPHRAGRTVFEGGNVPDEVLAGMAECLGLEPEAVPTSIEADQD
jgi:hypothetical protein